ncbi:MAG: hypothetical protein Q7W13_17375 [Bacteroidia bacterium]|nr:hypothetical protein [Bacteroidia bacterium]
MKPTIQTATGIFMDILALFSAGCANQPTVPALPETAYTAIAADAVNQLAALYPPAKTHFLLKANDNTLFNNAVKRQLRNGGYALHESTGEVPANSDAKQLTYVLDPLTDVAFYGYYRLTLSIDEAQLSRLYDANNLSKPNYWSYRK